MYRPKHFKLEELVDPELFKALGERCWELLDEDALQMLDCIRERFGPVVVNNWHTNGSSFTNQIYRHSGLRRMDSKIGSSRSQHKWGKAFDCKFEDYEPHQVFNYIVDHPEDFPLITRLENVKHTPTWLHFDTKETDGDDIYVFNP